MGKRFESVICAYCGAPGSTADHVFARSFFPETLRDDVPQVVACAPCNAEKSKIEHYLATILPFAGNHPLSKPMLEQQVPRRLARNAKLHGTLAKGQVGVRWTEGGTEQSPFGIPYDHDRLLGYLRYVANGLARAHRDSTIRQHYAVSTGLVTAGQDAILRNFFVGRGAGYARGNLGDGLIPYESRQAVDDPLLTMWRFLVYGGMIFSDNDAVLNIPRDLWAITAKDPMPGLPHN